MLGTPLAAEASPYSDEAEDSDEADSAVLQLDSDGVEITDMGQKMFEAMEDVELVLRFYAYRHLTKFSQGLNRITHFLDEFLIRGNKFDEATLEAYRSLFRDNIRFWHIISGATAFQVKGSKRHFSKIAFDALMYASSALEQQQRSALLKNPKVVQTEIERCTTHMPQYSGDGKRYLGRASTQSVCTRSTASSTGRDRELGHPI